MVPLYVITTDKGELFDILPLTNAEVKAFKEANPGFSLELAEFSELVCIDTIEDDAEDDLIDFDDSL